jgi:hypothetical protein
LKRRNFVSLVCLQCVYGHTSGQTRRSAVVDELLRSAEASLAKLDGATALNLFEKAAAIVHDSDVEVGIVRAHMQAGQFQRALSFCAHASGAHLDEPAPALLYAHLLKISGQTAYAEKLTGEYRTRFGGATSKHAPVKLAPYFDAAGLPANAKMFSSGLCLPDGKHVAIPAASLASVKQKFWVRSSYGLLSEAVLESVVDKTGLAILKLKRPVTLENVAPLVINAKPAFPGSVAFGLTFKQQLPLSWPLLWSVFMGNPIQSDPSRRQLDTPDHMPPPMGATVFDQTGAAIGMMAPSKSKLQLVPLNFRELGIEFAKTEQLAARQKIAIDQIYQIGYANIVQVIVNA